MQIEVLLFGMYREMAGTETVRLDLPGAAIASDAIAALRARGGSFARLPTEPVIAIDHEYARLQTPLHEGAELALIPPIAGG